MQETLLKVLSVLNVSQHIFQQTENMSPMIVRSNK